MRFILISIIHLVSFSLFSWPGDQESLSCIPEADRSKLINRADIEAQFNSTGKYAIADTDPNLETKKNANRAEAVKRVKDIARANHDMDYKVTKLGDSLSDLVDFYGVAMPRKIFPNYGDAAGTFGRVPLFMDSWTDYMTAGAGIIDPNAKLNFQNFGVSGYTTLSVMSTLGIDIQGDRENWNVAPNSSRCVKTRPMKLEFLWNYTEEITKEKSSMRSTLMVGGNDIIQSGLGFNGWMPFLNRYQVDSSLLNIMAITDWHIENGKQIFLEGTIPPFSHPAYDYYNGILINRQSLCKPLTDLLVDLNEVPWFALFVPGVVSAIIEWNVHVLTEVATFLTRIYNPKPGPNTSSPGGYLENEQKELDEKLDEFLDGFVEFEANASLTMSPAQKAEIKRQLAERRNAPEKQYTDSVSRILFTTASIAQACLNDRIKTDMLPAYKQAYPKNVDGYPLYSHFNQVGDFPNALNFWVPQYSLFRQNGLFFAGSKLWDAIHIGPEGYKAWGILVGSKIAALGYTANGDPNYPDIDVSLEMNDAWGIIKKAARNIGIIGKESTPRGVTVAATAIHYGGYFRNYTDGSSIYLKLYSSNTPGVPAHLKYRDGAIHLSKTINSLYKSQGGPEGKLGFPIAGTRCWGPGAFCNYKLTLFEKGFIQVDETPFFSSGPEIAVAVSDVPDSKKDSDPDFDTCVSTACGSRMMFHSKFYLQPTAGKAPFTFKVIGGSLPPGFELTPSGLDRKSVV